jgi:hypothetical protein
MIGEPPRTRTILIGAATLCAAGLGLIVSGEGAADDGATGLGLLVAAVLLLMFSRLEWLLRTLAVISGVVLAVSTAVNVYDWFAGRLPDPDNCDPFCSRAATTWIIVVVLFWLLFGVAAAGIRTVTWAFRGRGAQETRRARHRSTGSGGPS